MLFRSTHSLFEVVYGRYPTSTPADRLLPLIGATADAIDRLTLIATYEMLLSNSLRCLKKEWQPNQLGLLLIFNRESLFIFRLKVYSFVHRNANTLGNTIWIHVKLCLMCLSFFISTSLRDSVISITLTWIQC